MLLENVDKSFVVVAGYDKHAAKLAWSFKIAKLADIQICRIFVETKDAVRRGR